MMIYLDLDSLITFIVLWGILVVLLSIGIRRSRKKDIKEGKQTWLTKKSPKTLSIGIQVFLFLLLMLFIGGRILFSTLDISNLIKNMRTCDKVIINNYFIDYVTKEKIENHFIITDKTTLNSFADVFKDIISSNSFNRKLQINPIYYQDDYIEIEIYKNNEKVNSLIMIYDRLETHGKLINRTYSFYAHKTLLDEMRKKLLPLVH